MADTWTVLKLIAWTGEYFTKKQLDAPRLTGELLLAHVLGVSRVQLYMRFDQPLEKAELATFRALVERRAAGEPTAYLLGAREFYGRSFAVDPRVLVPRPETERLVEEVLNRLPAESPGAVLDLCTGSGCIAATLAAERPQLRLLGSDLSRDALEVARANVAALGLAERVELLEGDLFAPLGDRLFRAIVSNPPYVADGALAGLSPEVKREPRLALLAGPDGMQILERIAAGAPRHLEADGLLALEIGDDQGPLVQALLNRLDYRDVQIRPDWAGKDRIALARRPA
jgi:release factor glutamine methyltransferase